MTEPRWHDADPRPPYGGAPGSNCWPTRRARDGGTSSRDPSAPRPDAAPGSFGPDRGSSRWPHDGGLSHPYPEPYSPGPYRPAAAPAFYPPEMGSQSRDPGQGRWDAGRREAGRRDAGRPGRATPEPDDRSRRGWGTPDGDPRNPGTRAPDPRDGGRRVPEACGRDLRTQAVREAGWPRPRSRDWDQAWAEQIEPEQIEPEQRGSRQRGSRQRGSRPGRPGRASPGRRRRSRPAGPSWRWGQLSGGRGALIVIAAAVLGTGVTVAMHHDPGYLLGGAVIAGTFVAALAVRRAAVSRLIPVPALAYLVGALTAGLIHERSAESSRAGLAVSVTQWIAGGFVAMAAATAVAAAITVIHWLMKRHAGASGTSPRPEPPAADRLRSRGRSPSGPEADPWAAPRPRPLPQPTSAPHPGPSLRPWPEEPVPRGRPAPRREPPPPADPYSRRRSAPWPEPPSRPGPPYFGAPHDLIPTSRPGDWL
jgi:hypothetical protein